MMVAFFKLRTRRFVAAGMSVILPFSAALLHGQSEVHGRKYQPPPATAHIVVNVAKAFNSKPMINAAVVFHAVKNGKDTGNMEVKTDSNGNATMDFIEAGSHVTVQVISTGYATYAEEFDVTDADKTVLVKLKRPQAQVSDYQNNDGKASTVQPGVQERVKPGTVAAPSSAPTTMQTEPAPAAQPGVTPH